MKKVKNKQESSSTSGDVAIVGMSVSVPGAQNIHEYWSNLKSGIGSIKILDRADVLAAGEHSTLVLDPNYVPATARLKGFDLFDAEVFGFSPKEAAILDPQHRKFLEVAWEAIEQSGHSPDNLNGSVGVYAGCGMGSYFYFNICSNPGLVDDVGMFLLRHTGNDKDFLSTRVSHVFNLKGPSVNIQTACSTSLVAVHYACQALRANECEMALAGGVTIELPQGRGYLYKENEILSPDGQCHAFDHRAQGTVFGSGAGVVALRRLEDALADGDHIWAVIKGSAVNNDGADKAGYLAPSVEGQAEAVKKALSAANVSAETLDYVECHGTGTYLGDPIEVSALTEAYRSSTNEVGFCRIGSVKTNIGHLDTAAGVAGLVKAALALKYREIPPSLGYEKPNPAIEFKTSPFKVNEVLRPWQSHKGPRRAGVNALGVGGTNAHLILEEAPERSPSEESEFPFQVLCLSAQSKSALDAYSQNLAKYLQEHSELNLADVAFTLKEGRKAFPKRRVLVAETTLEAAEQLLELNPKKVYTHDFLGENPGVVFMFPGGGAQYAGMARDLYETEPVFAEWMDRGLLHLQKSLDYDIRSIWLAEDKGEAEVKLKKPSVQLPLIMIVEYALAQLWISWGVKPTAMVGHSMGENTAACIAGVMQYEDCIDLVLLRGRLFDTVPGGGMLSISLSLGEVEDIIGPELDIASVNAPNLTVVSGAQEELDKLALLLGEKDIDHKRVAIDIAAHSRMLDGILNDYSMFLRGLELTPPSLTVISNRTGVELTDQQATDPEYWVGQLRNTVHFADCISTLAATPGRVFLEVGPGKALSSLTQMAPEVQVGQVISSLRHPEQDIMDDAFFFGVIGRLWACGVEADWEQIWGESHRHRLPLPTYAFQRSQYYIEPGKPIQEIEQPSPTRYESMAEWGYRPAWRPHLADCIYDVETELHELQESWLIFQDDIGVGTEVARLLRNAGQKVITVQPGDTYAKVAEGQFVLPPEQGRQGYDALFTDLAEEGQLPTRIAHLWLFTQDETFRPGSSFFDRNLEMGFYSLTALVQGLANVEFSQSVQITTFTSGASQVRDEPLPYPEKAMVLGPLGVIPKEFPNISCASVDIEVPYFSGLLDRIRGYNLFGIAKRVLEELVSEPRSFSAAWRGDKRYELTWRNLPLEKTKTPEFRLGGNYLITGGYGGIGLTIAAYLIREYGANVGLLSREGLPPRSLWSQYLKSHSPANIIAQRIQAVQALEKTGRGRIYPLTADVCHSSQMQSAIDLMEARYGKLTGVIHAAGYIKDGPILAKSEDDIAQVFAPKVSGLRVLSNLFPDGYLELMVLFSSSSTVTTPAGQVDYVAANEYLNAWAKSRANDKTRVVAVDWGVWSDVGMASDAMNARLGGDGPSPREACSLPLFNEQGYDTFGNRYFATELSTKNWLVDEHRTQTGIALVPGTGYLELAAEALRGIGYDDGFDLEDLYFLRPLVVSDNEQRELILRLTAQDDGYEVQIYGFLDDGYMLCAYGRMVLWEYKDTPRFDLAALKNRCPITPPDTIERLRSPQEKYLVFGPRWHVLKGYSKGAEEGLARLQLPELAVDDGCIMHPGLMDLATGWAIDLVPSYRGDALWVPVSYGQVRCCSPLTEEVYSYVRLVEAPEEGFATFDITLMDSSGRVLVDISSFQMKRLVGGFEGDKVSSPDTSAEELGLVKSKKIIPLSSDERRLQYNIDHGISSKEGGLALERALAAGGSQIVVSALDIPALIQQAAQSGSGERVVQVFERPELDTDFVAPKNSVEETVASLYASLLGVAKVGADDSFFELGGHSLVAVRLFAQIKRAFEVEFPMSVLFEAPSVAALAERIIQRTGGGITTESEPSDTAKDAHGHRHLVLLHPGDGIGRRPFFLVAGMFGNVLNLRHLALMVGKDRPVYGLQAKGLIGEEPPHTRIEDAARDYLAEIRNIQPNGPYLLGGFSGGGITAYEMAQQLQAEGQETSALVLLDTPMPVRPSLTSIDRALIQFQEFGKKGPSYVSEWAIGRITWELDRRRFRPAETGQKPAFNNRKIELAFLEAVALYRLRPWDGSMTLFRPPLDRHWKGAGGHWVNRDKEYVFDDNNWTRWAPRVRVVEVPGDHDSMVLIPNVSVLAAELKRVLDAADRGDRRRARGTETVELPHLDILLETQEAVEEAIRRSEPSLKPELGSYSPQVVE